MDPRVKITPEVQQIFTLTTRAENNARAAAKAYKDARALAEKTPNEALKKEIEALAPVQEAPRESGGGRGGFGAAEPPPAPNLANIGGLVVGSVMGMQGSEMPPTATQIQAASSEEAAYTAVMAKWAALKAKVSGPPKSNAAGKQ